MIVKILNDGLKLKFCQNQNQHILIKLLETNDNNLIYNVSDNNGTNLLGKLLIKVIC